MIIQDDHRSLFEIKQYWICAALLGGFQGPRSFGVPRVGQYLVNFSSLSGIGNTTVYKTKPGLIGLGLGKFP